MTIGNKIIQCPDILSHSVYKIYMKLNEIDMILQLSPA